jgi:O-antigen ligase
VTIWRNGLEVLADHPLGVGPAGLANRDLLGRTVEIHNDYLGYLIERGPLAVIGLAGFAVVLWRRGGRHGATRLLIVTIAVGMATRETLHFRHLWLFLAFAFAYDVRARRLTT